MRWTAIITAVMAAQCIAQDIISKSKDGIIVMICQKYGDCWIDTGTVLSKTNGQFVLTKKNGQSGWYPDYWHSVKVIEKCE